MKKEVPFEFFEPGQYLYFDIGRLMQLEKLLGESLVKITERAANGDISLNFVVAALTVGLKHHYLRGNEQFFADKLTDCLENGGDWQGIIAAITEAVMSIWVNKKESDIKNVETAQNPELTV